jgi:hypothetical protein
MAKTTPAFSSKTKLDNEVTTDVKVSMKRTVTYIFDVTSAENLNIPYAVAIRGVAQEEFRNKPKRVSGASGKITIRNVEPGNEVVLFLNSDAHPGYRLNPVYPITPGDRDVVVKITEKKGKHSDTDMPTRINTTGSVDVDNYQAFLTGDIWMKVSHKYSPAEAFSLIPPEINQAIKDAIRKIYDGLSQASLEINVSGTTSTDQRTVLVTFNDGENARENIIRGYDFLKEGLTRVHPSGYAAVFSAAIEAKINKVALTSAWRPMLGSIAHRAGLGLDINYVGTVRMKREKLRKASATDAGTVSQAEQNLFASLERAKTQQIAAKKNIAVAELEVKNARSESEKLILAKQKLKDVNQAGEVAEKNRKDAEAAWNAERDKNEPDEVRRFRAALMKSRSVSQLFDPWFMDSDSRDNISAIPNMQISGNEKLHAHHLHITVYEPKIL